MAVEHLPFQCSEERLHDAVVDAVALTGHRLDYPFFPKPFAVLPHLVLPALVAVEDQAFQVGVLRERLVQHPRCLPEVGQRRQVPCDDVGPEHVQYGRQVRLAEGAAELRDVGRPFLVRPRRREIAAYHVVRDRADGTQVRMVFDLRPYGLEPQLGHEPLDLLVVDDESAVPELRGDPPHAVPRLVLPEDRPHFIDDALVFDVGVGFADLEVVRRSGQGGRLEQDR